MTKRLLKFENVGCGYCTMAQNHLDSTGVKVENINVFNNPELSSLHDIGSIPTFILLDENDHEISRMVGFHPSRTKELDEITAQL